MPKGHITGNPEGEKEILRIAEETKKREDEARHKPDDHDSPPKKD
jgi:hypothetical protein